MATPLPRSPSLSAGHGRRCDAGLRRLLREGLIRQEPRQQEAEPLAEGGRARAGLLLGGTLARDATTHWRQAPFAGYPMALPAASLGRAAAVAAAMAERGSDEVEPSGEQASPRLARARRHKPSVRRIRMSLQMACSGGVRSASFRWRSGGSGSSMPTEVSKAGARVLRGGAALGVRGRRATTR